MNKPSLCIAIVGPTASGKTKLAIELAEQVNGEIICMDSTTVYKGFDIGSSKPTSQERARVPHHLLDILSPGEPFSAHHFVDEAEKCIEAIEDKCKIPIVVGGTYFYLRALQHGMYSLPAIPADTVDNIEKEFYVDDKLQTDRMHDELKARDPLSADKIHPNDRYRLLRALAVLRTTGELPSSLKPSPASDRSASRIWLKYALALSRHSLSDRIAERTDSMLKAGLVEETRSLRQQWPTSRALGSVGYAETCQFLDQKLTEDQLRTEIIEKTRQLAKRQTTWTRSDPELRYVDTRDVARMAKELENLKFVIDQKTWKDGKSCNP
jgi:tRNA dimethylallyltransferase